MCAYYYIEQLLFLIKSESLKDIFKLYLLKDEGALKPLRQKVYQVKDDSVWLSVEMKQALRQLIHVLFLFENKQRDELKAEDTKDFYEDIKAMVLVIEDTQIKDLKSLHKVRRFLRNKQVI